MSRSSITAASSGAGASSRVVGGMGEVERYTRCMRVEVLFSDAFRIAFSKPSFQTATEPYNTTRHHSSVLCGPTHFSLHSRPSFVSHTRCSQSLVDAAQSSHPATLVVVVAHQTSSHKPPSLHTHHMSSLRASFSPLPPPPSGSSPYAAYLP